MLIVLFVCGAGRLGGKVYRLNLVIVRLANVYGEYCSKVVATILCMARVYAYLKEEMKWLWTKDLRTHTVHVTDVARALWHAADWYTHGKKGWDDSTMGSTPLFNIVDHGDTCDLSPLPKLSSHQIR